MVFYTRINIDHLRPGDFIHHFNCGWLFHPFVFNHFKISNEKSIERMRKWGIREVYIDTDKGLDIGDLTQHEDIGRSRHDRLENLVIPSDTYLPEVPVKQELRQAQIVKKEARQVVHAIISDIRAGKKLKMASAYSMMDKMEHSIDRNKDALIYLMRIRTKDEYTLMHSISVGALVLSLCTTLKMDHAQRRKISIGALLHDVGKIKVPSDILKKPQSLTPAEFEEMKKHVLYPHDIFQNTSAIPEEAHEIAAQHHERFDGSGYPFGLRDKEINFGAQITAVADVYDAITADRCYRNGIAPIEGLQRIYEWSAFHFNQEIAQRFIKCVGIYPIGSVVRLESGLVGVVIDSNPTLLSPVVQIFYNAKRNWPVTPRVIDLSKSLGQGGGDRIVSHERPEKWQIDTQKIMKLLAEKLTNSD